MATISIGKAWEEAVAFVAREAALLFPVALLFVALPGLILQEMTPPQLAEWMIDPKRTGLPDIPPGFALASLLGVVLIWFGSLTLFALALRPGISVGEALRLGLARLPVLLGTALLAMFLLAALVLASIVVAVLLGLIAPPLGNAAGALLGILVGGVALFASIRLMLLNPAVIDGNQGVIQSLRHAWALTRGCAWRLLGFIMLLTIVSAIASMAAQTIFGAIAGLVGGPGAAQLVGGIAAAAVSTVIQVYMLVMLSRIYRQASAG
ncbi:hypothetical protein PMI04_017070 [Sphingobium sp. AP49]|uniref:hypothetical protein n=1 Tax=Sphingobium sp. AP49 TaxID=1144307 RepID=UPI00026EE7EA|nr:hypothetical protein [Sphingobium sp. AP49]WHO38248.1 hypothetical protein PMI04_017070 [Sphingobium sp. AP49]